MCHGYEIHMGQTHRDPGAEPLCVLQDGQEDGCRVSDRVMGSYIHGILDNREVIDALLAPYAGGEATPALDYEAYKEEQYDALAAMLREHIDIDRIYEIMKGDDRGTR